MTIQLKQLVTGGATGRRIASLAVAGVLALALIGCSGSTGVTAAAPSAPVFTSSGATLTVDQVVLAGGTASGDTVQVNVKMGGPSTSSDLYSFAFDVIIGDPTVLRFVPPAAIGNVLTGAPAELSVDAVQTTYSPADTRVVVGVTKLGAALGNSLTTGDGTIVTLTFQTLKKGSSTIKLAGAYPDTTSVTAAALDHTGAKITSVIFDSGAATVTQP